MSDAATKIDAMGITSCQQLDTLFLEILGGLGEAAVSGAGECTKAVLDLAANYTDKPALDILKKFHELYFLHGDMEKKKDEVNSEVTDMVSYLQEKLAAGEDISLATELVENEAIKSQRLSLAAVQKQLEGIIVLDVGIREQMMPALTSMQFEDAVRQRMQHVIGTWSELMATLPLEAKIRADYTELARTLGKKMSSVEETKSYYQLVLKEEAPEGQEQRGVFIEF